MEEKVSWTSAAGGHYEFDACSIKGDWSAVGGVYCFGYKDASGIWAVIYVDQTEDFSQRIPGHEKWLRAKRAGATHVLACAVADESLREQLENELIRYLNPNLNQQLRAA